MHTKSEPPTPRANKRNYKIHIFGDLEFADDTATIATEAEFPTADRLLEQTFTDWGEKLNRAKTETLLLKPGTLLNNAGTPPMPTLPSVM